jgi:TonB family protein
MKKTLNTVVVVFFSFFIFQVCGQDLKPASNLSGKFGYTDGKGTVVIPYQFDNADDFHNDLAAVKTQGKWGFINKTGKMVIAAQFELTYYFVDNFCPVKKNNKWYYINKKGKKSFGDYYLMALPYSNDLAAVKTETGWGYIDHVGNFAVKAEYEEANTFSEGLANIKDGDVWGYINNQGDVVIDTKYDEAKPFKNGIATVKLNGRTFQIDKNGKKYVPPPEEKKEDTNMIYTIVDQRPEFPGGHEELFRFIQGNQQYPPEEKEKKIEGLVIVSVIVSRWGELKNIQVIQGDNENFKKEALRIVGIMPKWIPGKMNNKPVNVQTTIPVRYRIGK